MTGQIKIEALWLKLIVFALGVLVGWAWADLGAWWTGAMIIF